jgi:large subunit ribosomal protein L3
VSEATPTSTAEKPAVLPAGQAGAPTPSIKAILAQKIGMTRVYDAHGKSIPVTVLQAGPCPVTQVLTAEKNGYSAIQVAFGEVRVKSINKPIAGIFKKANTAPAKWIREFRTDKASAFQVGQALKVDSFAAGDYVDVFGISKGKGFAGAMKRWNFHGGPHTHGQSDRARAPGSSGSNTYPGRVFKGKKFPGHLGVERVSVQHLEVVQVMADKDLMLIKGAVPGPLQGLITIRGTVKRMKVRVLHAPEPGKKEKTKKEAAKAAPAAAKPAAKAAGK